MPEVRQRAADARIAPRRVLVRQACDERGEVGRGAWPARSALIRAIVFLVDQQTVPAQNRIRRRDAGDVGEALSAEGFAFHGQTASLVVGQANTVGPVRRAEDRFSSRK